MTHRQNVIGLVILVALAAGAVVIGVSVSAQSAPDRCLVPATIRDAILNETSGEEAYQHVQMLAVNRNRPAEEYQNEFFETTYLRTMAKQYGLADVQVEFFPTRDTWDAEEADLWLTQPVRRKIASLNMVPTALAQGSTSGDVEAEVVYVGPGREADYAGKDVKGKIVLGSGSVGSVFTSGVVQRGAVAALGTGSAGVSANSSGYTLDQLGWSSVSANADRPGLGFVLSLRQFYEIRDYLERGQKVVVRAHVRTKTYPGKMNVISATIPGTDPAAGELIAVAHAYETIATPGANDNCTGVATILEVARTITRLVRDGLLPQPRRTIRFVWGPEISGTTAYMFKHPELQDRLLAALNFDMTGADLAATGGYLRMKMTPDSRPSYLNDLIASLLQFADQTEIRTQQGTNQPFNYRLTPVAAITSGSDHSVFNNGGIPAMQFNHWPDNFYHSSHDRIVYVDATELKRTSFIAAAAFYYLATAGPAQARDLAWDAAANGEKWIAEVTRQAQRLLGSDPAKLPDQYKAAQNKVTAAYNRARGGVESVLTLASDPGLTATVRTLVATLDVARDANAKMLEGIYKERCTAIGIKPLPPALTPKETELSLMVPRRLFKVYSPDAQKQQAQGGGGRGGRAQGLPGLAANEIGNFIDGSRSVLDIYNAVRAECGNLVTGNNDMKFAYVLSPEAADVDLDAVVTTIQNMEKAGAIEIVKKAPPPVKGKKKQSAP
jgi:aminopeptidase YwaD